MHFFSLLNNLSTTDITFITIAYLIGSIPFGLMICRLSGKGDIRRKGSGNIGATNVLRVAGKTAAFITLVTDSLKGAVIVLIAKDNVDATTLTLVATSSVIGHIFPVWLGFKGGKGVATSLAVITAVNYHIGIYALAIWLISFAMSRISSFSSLMVFTTLPIVAYNINLNTNHQIFIFLISVLVILKHSSNIIRLIKKQEGRSHIK